VENLTPPANGKNRPGLSTASASRDAGTPPAGTVPALTMPTGTGTHPAGTIAASADQRPEQQRTPRRLPWPFSFAHLPAAGPAACPLHRIACRIGADQ
jgi:hypothetical protein